MSHEFLNFILAIAIIIVAAKAAGYVTTRLGQPSVLGELLAGLILGPTALDMLNAWPVFSHDESLSHSITMMAELGVILLMMLAGLELHLSELLSSGKVAALSGTLGVIVPLILGWGIGRYFGSSNVEAIFIGLALSATSVSISAQTLMELNVLRSRVGLALLGAAVFDDILVILLLSVTTILVSDSGGGIMGIAVTVMRMVGYIGGASLIGIWIIPRLATYVNRLPISQGLLAFSLVAALIFAWAAEVVGGMAAITGAFMLGLFLARTPYHTRIENGVSALAYGFFVPIFFVNIGLLVNMRGISGGAWWFAVILTIAAIAGKILGCGFGAMMGGFNRLDSLRLGIGMVSRGEVGLIVAAFAIGQGLFSPDAFSIVVFMVIIATLVTPPMLRAAYSTKSSPDSAAQPSG